MPSWSTFACGTIVQYIVHKGQRHIGQSRPSHGGSDGGSNGDNKTAELLHEATQLLKTLRMPTNPKMKVMQLSNVETVDDNYILLDSGATHALRPARDEGEWMAAERTSVQLADGTTEMFRLKKNTKILLAAPNAQVSWIIPMGGLSDLDFSLEWRDGLFKLKDDEGREVRGAEKWMPYDLPSGR